MRLRTGQVKSCSFAAGLAALAAVLLVSEAALAADPWLLASSCSGCHGSFEGLSTGIPRIQGLPEAAIVSALHAFRSGERPSTVMGRIAKGYTEDEIRQLAAYYSAHK